MARRIARFALVAAIALAWCCDAVAGQERRREIAAAATTIFPGAGAVGDYTGAPPSVPVFVDGDLQGYLFSTWDAVQSVGYSGQPVDVVAGLGTDGRIAGAVLQAHNEPILVIGVAEDSLRDYVAGFAGVDITLPFALEEAAAALPPAIAGATVSSGVIRDALVRAARAVARDRGLLAPDAGVPQLDRDSFAPATWEQLTSDGSLVRMRLSRGAVTATLARQTGGGAAGTVAGDPADTFIELYAGLATPATVGQNLLGSRHYNAELRDLGPDDQLLFVAARGGYSFKGTRYRRTGVFDRLQLVQGEKTIRLLRAGYRNLTGLALADAPELRELALFRIPAATGFDPLRAWRLELLVARETGDGGALLLHFPVAYALPPQYLAGAAQHDAFRMPGLTPGAAGPQDVPTWLRNWGARPYAIAVLVAMLLLLTAILVFQDVLVSHPLLYRRVRIGYLAVTLFWLGLYAGAQLSVFNVLTFTHALLTGFRWEVFLLDPLIFILWGYVAVTLLFWGRGVFCGWLCPFGALQELLNELARRFRVPQLTVPFAVHERLWPIKHILFLGLVAVSLHSMTWAVLGTEVEPFKTAISLKFVRHWPFVAYAVALLLAGLFIERFYCRYLCPLGAALAIPARLRMFEWLKRRFQCGRDCQICATRCTVQAIHPTGEINPNECIYCLACQAHYSDDRLCPPLVQRRKRREKLLASDAAHSTPGGQP